VAGGEGMGGRGETGVSHTCTFRLNCSEIFQTLKGILLSFQRLRGRGSFVEFLTNCSINTQPLLSEQIIFFKMNSR
jgi:hypothetical protein